MDQTYQDRIIDVSGLTKVFHDFWRRPKVRAVDSISFDVSRGFSCLLQAAPVCWGWGREA